MKFYAQLAAWLVVMLSVQHTAIAEPNVVDVLEADVKASKILESIELQHYEPGETPLSTMLVLAEAAEAKNWELAAEYFDFRYLPKPASEMPKQVLMQQLSAVWKQHRLLDISTISQEPKGHPNDGLPPYRDLLGTIPLNDTTVPIYLQLVPGKNGGKVWKVSNASLARVPDLWEEYGYHPAALQLGEWLPDFRFLGMDNWQAFGLIAIVICAWFFSSLYRTTMLWVISHSVKYKDALRRFFAFPTRWLVFFLFIKWNIGYLGLPFKSRVIINDNTLGYLAAVFCALAVIELVTAIFLSNTQNKRYWGGIIRPVRTMLKILTTLIIVLMWASDAGFNISTLIAGLGIGSLAIALAAQKTLENVIGALTLYIAKPVSPGDFCNFGDVCGTIEEIGLRSTSIRRLDRTLVHVPNSVLVSVNLENISETDRRRFNRKLWLPHDASDAQLRLTIIKLRELLWAHSMIADTSLRVHLEEIERDAYRIGLHAYIKTGEFDEYMMVAEDINFRIIEILESTGLQLAAPKQNIHWGKQPPLNEQLAQSAEETMAEREVSNHQGFPDLSQDEKQALEDSIHFEFVQAPR